MPSRKSRATWRSSNPEPGVEHNHLVTFRFLPATLCGLLVTAFPASSASLEQVLAAMDKAAASFRGMSASLRQSTYTAVIKDTSEETGTIRLQRCGKKDVRVRIEFGEPDMRTVAFAGQKAEIYYPRIQTAQVYDLGKHRQLVDQFLLLGFGMSGREIQEGYSLKVAGEEKIGGEPVTRLELTPKSAAVRGYLTEVHLWVSASGTPVQQKFYKPSGDHTLITYSGLQVNPGFPKDALALKLPPGVKREYPQK